MKTLTRFAFVLFLVFIFGKNVQAQLFAGFNATSPSNGCTPFHKVDFVNTSTGDFDYVGWDFDNDGTIDLEGNPSSNPNINTPTWPFQDAGVYSVRIVVKNTTNNEEDEFSIQNFITTFQSPVADFSANPLEGCGTEVVSFTDESTPGDASIITWDWEFGNGMLSSEQNPVITFTNVSDVFQQFSVTLILLDGNLCTSNKFKLNYIQLDPGVIPDFELDPPSACEPPVTVQINDLSEGVGTLSYLWDFGNGQTSTASDPDPVEYTDFGTYTIKLTLASDLCERDISKTFVIDNDIEASFDYSANCEGTLTQFENTSDDVFNVFSWDFGDGSAPSTDQNPEHLYVTAGTYTVTLTQSINGDCEVVYQEDIVVNAPEDIDINTDTNYIVCQIPQNVQIDVGNSNIVEFSWQIVNSDGLIVFIGDTYPISVTFTENHQEGEYFVSMNALFDTGCESSADISIIVSYPVIGGEVGPDFGCIPLEISFENTSSYEYGIDSVLWTFGDGLDTNAGTFIYNYTDTAYSFVFLTVYTGAGCNVTIPIDTLGTGMHTYPDFDWPHPDTLNGEDTIKICYDELLDFLYTGPDTIGFGWGGDSIIPTPHAWNWSNAITSQDENPQIGLNFPDTGYTVMLVTEHFGCKDTIMYQIDSLIGVGPIPEFSMNPTFMCLKDKPYDVVFYNTSEFDTLNSTLFWDFDEGTTSTEINPDTITYPAPGVYAPSLTITTVVQIEFEPDSFLTCDIDFPKFPYFVTIDNYEIYSINANSFEFCDDGSATLLATVSSPVFPPEFSQNIWDFGDGSPNFLTFENDAIAEHFYDSAGVYDLTVIGTNGVCPDTIVEQVYVYALPTAGFMFDTIPVCASTTDSIQLFDTSLVGDLAITGWKYTYFPGGPFEGLTDQNPWLQITQAQDYFVSLQVTDEFGCKSPVITEKIDVHDIVFDVPDQNTCNNALYEVEYDLDLNDIDYPPVTFFWEFGNGATDTTDNPFVEFTDINQDSTFTNYLTITDSTGCTSTQEFDIGITLPQMSYSQQFDEFNCDNDGSFVARFLFTVTSDNTNIETIIMDFGDETAPAYIDTVEQAINWPHTYTAPGLYTITFTVIDVFGCSNTVVLEDWVDVSGPLINPSYTTQDTCPPLLVQFIAEDTANIDTFTWFFGDGTSSNEVEPTNTYMQAGTFYPFLWVQASIVDENGDTLTCTIQYTDMDPIVVGGPVLSLDAGNLNCEGTPVTIANNSTNPEDFAVQWQWDFGDGTELEIQNTVIPTDPQPHDYAEGGDYVVSLTALSENGSCVYTIDSAIFVAPALDLQPLGYDPGCTPLTIEFVPDIGDLINQIDNPSWDFGDGGTSNELTPTHTYTTGGQEYTVVLSYFANNCQFYYTYPEPVSVYANPVADFTYVPVIEGNAVSSYTASNQSEGYQSVLWIFNGDTISGDNQVTVQVGEGDNYLSLIAFTENSCTDTLDVFLEPIEAVNIITPNNDGQNDVLFFDLSNSQMQCSGLKVFNRWGKLVYSDDAYSNNWNGINNNGNNLAEGTYFYILNICGEGALRGYITIAR